MSDDADDVEDTGEAERGPGGRPTPYRDEFAEQAKKLCNLGATDMELADFFKVDVRTIYRWKHSEPEFCQALIVGKEALDTRVVRSLYHRAVGYSYESEKIFSYQGGITRADCVEHVLPDPGAIKLWLLNRQPETWREKTTVEHELPEALAGWLGQR